MGLRGPAPKPENIKRLEGNPGKRKLSDGQRTVLSPNVGKGRMGGIGMQGNAASVKPPKPPKHLMEDARIAWKRLAPMLVANGLLSPMTADHFGETCQWWAKYQVTNRKMMEEGEAGVCRMQVSESGYESQRPIVSLCGQYYDRWEKGIKEYGMTPVSWARYMSMMASQQEGAEDDDPLESMLSG